MFHTLTLLRQGGWTMLPLGLCSLTALAIIIERLLALRRNTVIDPKVLRLLESCEGEPAMNAAMNVCQRCGGAFAHLVIEVFRSRNLDYEHGMENMRAAGRAQVVKLERGLTTLEIIGGVSPLLGLLGTALGMIDMFNAISAAGLGNPQILSDGIAKALVTTVSGLVVAIPAVAFHGLFSKRVEELAMEMQDQATSLLLQIHAQREGR